MVNKVIAYPPEWKGDYLSIYFEDDNGKGKTVLHYSNRTIVLSELIGCSKIVNLDINIDTVLWDSFYGRMITDGKIIKTGGGERCLTNPQCKTNHHK